MFPAAAGVAALLVLATTGAARAASSCTVEQALELVAGGFSQEQVDKICTILAAPSAGALSPETSDPPSAFGSDVLTPEIGRDEAWARFVREDTYILQNKTDPASGYLQLSTGPELAWESFGVEVRFTHEAMAEGVVGPVLAFGAGGGRTRMFSIAHDGTCQAAELGDSGIAVRDKRRDPAWEVGDHEWVEIGVARKAGGAELLVRGRPTGLTLPIDVASGPVGLGVFGIGSYEFRRFRHTSSGAASGAPGGVTPGGG